MAILALVTEPNMILRKKASPLSRETILSSTTQDLIKNMKETLKNTPDGVGLAAPQVGKSLQIFIVSEEAQAINAQEAEAKKAKNDIPPADAISQPRLVKPEWNYYVFINPKVKSFSKRKLERPEGCLSVPGKFGPVLRYEKITVEAHDEHGKKFTRGASKFVARVLQHELDHLVGTIFIDKAKKVFDVHNDASS